MRCPDRAHLDGSTKHRSGTYRQLAIRWCCQDAPVPIRAPNFRSRRVGFFLILPARMKRLWPSLLVSLLLARAGADEGMWLFNQPPRQLLKERYQFNATEEWLEQFQMSSI